MSRTDDEMICDFSGCGRVRYTSIGYCKAHYEQNRAGKELKPLKVRTPLPESCIFPDCGRKPNTAGYCTGHIRQFRTGQELRPISKLASVKTRDGKGRKRCSFCQRWLAEDRFGICRRGLDGLNVRCKTCNIIERYNVSAEWYEEATAQGCGICRRTDNLHVDHDHACCPGAKSCGNCVRGILCYWCNHGLGRFFDSPDLLVGAAFYLARSPQKKFLAV